MFFKHLPFKIYVSRSRCSSEICLSKSMIFALDVLQKFFLKKKNTVIQDLSVLQKIFFQNPRFKVWMFLRMFMSRPWMFFGIFFVFQSSCSSGHYLSKSMIQRSVYFSEIFLTKSTI